jgi:hypothetical protein
MRRRVLWAAFVVAAAGACRQLVGITDQPPADLVDSGIPRPDAGVEAGPACGLGYTPASCETCLDSHCCGELRGCSGVAECKGFETCAGACKGDPSCRAQCFQSYRPETDPKIAALESCLVTSCASECEIECGGAAELATPDAAATCQQCFTGQACQSAAACLGNGGCATDVFCFLSSSTPDTQATCMAPIDAGLDGAPAAFQVAAMNQCLEACGFDSNWSCLGRVEWPPPVKGGMTLQFSLYNVVMPQLPLPGVTAKLCEVQDTSCSHPGTTALSDSLGNVTLTVPDGGVGNFYVGYIDLSGGGIAPELFFWSFPISQNVAQLGSILTATPDQITAVASSVYDGGWDAAASGVVTVVGLDCYLLGGAGLTFSIMPPAVPPTAFYVGVNGDNFQPGLTETTSAGIGAFVNVPPGPVVVTASLPPPMGAIGQFTAFVRPGTVSLVVALPSPP